MATDKPADNRPANPPAQPTAPQPTAPQPNVVSIDDARAAGRAEAIAYMREVNEICALAGHPDKAQAFIDKEAKPADVRKELLEARASADAARTVTGHILPNAGATPAAGAPKKVTASAGMLKLIGKGA